MVVEEYSWQLYCKSTSRQWIGSVVGSEQKEGVVYILSC